MSQNELIEQALEHELSLRGARIADDLAEAAKTLSDMSDASYRSLVESSITSFVAGEDMSEPFQAYALHTSDSDPPPSATGIWDDPFGVLAAFDSPPL